jgi:hypothetical protein
VVVPGSGRGPQEVCERVVQRCRTVVVPGSGRGRKRFANASCNDAGRWLLLVRAEGRSRSADEVSSIET